ncbi:MAG: hypothetical protein ACOYOB_07950 [Myxococcota bacterium]
MHHALAFRRLRNSGLLIGLAVVTLACSAAKAADPQAADLPTAEPTATEPAKPAPPKETAPPAAERPAPPPADEDTRPEPDDKRPEPPPAVPPKAVEPSLATAIGVVSEFPAGTPDGVLREAFRCALEASGDAEGFACYARINVEANRSNDIALMHLKTYQWRYFRQRAPSYLVGTKPFSVRITRRDAPTIESGMKSVKMFLKSSERENPAPISLRLEDGEWRIYANSL